MFIQHSYHLHWCVNLYQIREDFRNYGALIILPPSLVQGVFY